MRGRQVFFDSLLLHGATKIFGNPGTTESPLLDGLTDYPDIEYIMHLHEGVAIGAANFYAQASNSTAIVNIHVAPGLGNAIGMIYGALKNNSPVIITAGAQDTRARLREPLLGYDLVAMAAPVVKWSVQVEHADEMSAVLQRAFKVANEYPKGPVFVALPINVMEQETQIGAMTTGEISDPPLMLESSLDRIATLINGCKKPIIVAGDDIVRAGAVEDLVNLSEKAGIGVHVEIVTGRFAFPSKHPHFQGRLGLDLASIQTALSSNDLVILVGGPFFEEVWYSDSSPFAENAKVVQLEAGPERLGKKYSITFGAWGNLRDALNKLHQRVNDAPERRKALAKSAQQVNENELQRLEALRGGTPMALAEAMEALGSAIPANAVIVDESITGAHEIMRHLLSGDTSDYYAGRGGGIGQGLAGAPGVAVAMRDRQVVAVSGDGSSMYSIQALWTAAHHQLQILFVILSNREYRVLKHNTDQYRKRYDAPSNKAYPQMDLVNPLFDFVQMANGMGVPARQASNASDISSALAEALATPGPFLLDIVVQGLETR